MLFPSASHIRAVMAGNPTATSTSSAGSLRSTVGKLAKFLGIKKALSRVGVNPNPSDYLVHLAQEAIKGHGLKDYVAVEPSSLSPQLGSAPGALVSYSNGKALLVRYAKGEPQTKFAQRLCVAMVTENDKLERAKEIHPEVLKDIILGIAAS